MAGMRPGTLYRYPDGTPVVVDAETGQWRAATPQEAAQQAAPGAGSQQPGGPTGGSTLVPDYAAPPDPYAGYWGRGSLGESGTLGSGGMGGTVPANPDNPTPPGNPGSFGEDPSWAWEHGDPGARPWRYIADDATKKFYEDNPTQAWQQFNTDMFGGRATPLTDYAQGQYGRYYADYLRWSEGDPTGQRVFTDTLSNDLAGKIRQSFTMQSPGQKGYQLSWQPSGRFTG